jgi:hypothetical protein
MAALSYAALEKKSLLRWHRLHGHKSGVLHIAARTIDSAYCAKSRRLVNKVALANFFAVLASRPPRHAAFWSTTIQS